MQRQLQEIEQLRLDLEAARQRRIRTILLLVLTLLGVIALVAVVIACS